MHESRPRLTTHARAIVAAVALGALSIPATWAQQTPRKVEDPGNTGPTGSQWGLGLGIAFDRKPYRSFDDKAEVIPLIMYTNRYVSILGPTIDVHLPSAGPVSFRVRARYSDDGYEADDSAFLAGMDKRKASFWLGGAAIWSNRIANLSAELLADSSGNSEGTRFKVQVDRRFAMGAYSLTPRVAAHRMDDKYVKYYYGVRASEARIGRELYEGEAAVNVEAGLRIDYALAHKQDVFVDLSATRLGSGIRNSPLVDRSGSAALRLGYLYRF